MSKRDSEGDVLTNRLALGLAKNQKLLASWMGEKSEPFSAVNDAAKPQEEDDDLKQDYAHDRLGVGSILPKDIANGSFTHRIPTSNDKLLVQLLGKKKAKAHFAAQQEAARPNGMGQKFGKPVPVSKAESDDEEEGRAATFKSKRSRSDGGKMKKVKKVKKVDSDDEDEEQRAERLAKAASGSLEKVPDQLMSESEPTADVPREDEPAKEDEKTEEVDDVKTAPKRTKSKPKSFLDEILAERSQKASRKTKGKSKAETEG